MATEQTSSNAVAEAVRVAMQAMNKAETERSQIVGPKLGRPIMKY